MNDLLMQQIRKMDKKSEAFFELYQLVDEKYWDIDEPDENVQMRKTIRLMINRSPDWMVTVVFRLLTSILKVAELKESAFSGSFEAKGKTLYFSVYDKPESIDRLTKMLSNTVVVTAQAESEAVVAPV